MLPQRAGLSARLSLGGLKCAVSLQLWVSVGWYMNRCDSVCCVVAGQAATAHSGEAQTGGGASAGCLGSAHGLPQGQTLGSVGCIQGLLALESIPG